MPPRPLRVLLAEDTPANQKLLCHVLGKRGHAVEIARTGREAVELVDRRGFDAVLMDVQMPVMDGFQATAAIRAARCAAKGPHPHRRHDRPCPGGRPRRCLAAGMDGYLSKPVNGDELIELVEHLSGFGPGQVRRQSAATKPADESGQPPRSHRPRTGDASHQP